MKSIKKPVKFKSLSLPEPLFNEMKEYVQTNKKYRNMAEFLREAIREKMEKDEYNEIKKFREKEVNKRITLLEKRIKKLEEKKI